MNLRPKGRINVEFSSSSMTDVIFLLLIFFIIISSVVKDPALKLILPKGVNTQTAVNPIIRVYIDQNLNYAVDDKKISYERLPSALNAALTNNPGATVSIHGDKNIKYENVMEVVLLANNQDAKVVLALERTQ